MNRRSALVAAACATLGLVAGAKAAAPAPKGLVIPRAPAPNLPLTDASGKTIGLSSLLHGKVSAVQLMFAGCSSTCPVQGAVFASVAQQIHSSDAQLLSLTIDPLADDPKALRTWLGRFGRHGLWTAAAPRVQDVDSLAEFLRGVPPRSGTHPSQVFLFDRQARLAFRTVEQPSPEHLLGLLEQLAAA